MAGEIQQSQVTDNVLSADTAGRAKMQAGFLNAATVADKFDTDAMPSTHNGAPMWDRLNLATVPANGETVTIGADVYEFRNSTPPAGGTAGRIWVYEGGGVVATARANFINAVNNVTDAPNITYDGAVTEAFRASSPGGAETPDIHIRSTTAVGSSTLAPSATATACSDTLGAPADVWDNATCRGGKLVTTRKEGRITQTLTAQDIVNTALYFYFPFAPAGAIVFNLARAQNEAVTLPGNQNVRLALAGGASPNNQAGDTLVCLAWE